MAKKEQNLDRTELAIQSAEQSLKERQPSKDYGVFVFRLFRGDKRLLKPKFLYSSPEGNKVSVRYSPMFNTIFVPEQDDNGEAVKLEYITIGKTTTVRDRVLANFIMLHPSYGKHFGLVDPAGDAKKELEKQTVVDDLWYDARSLPEESLKALLMLMTDMKMGALVDKTLPELRLTVKGLVNKRPFDVKEALEDPVLKTLYLYSSASFLDVIKYIPKQGIVIWTDTKKELCKVPVNKDPAIHVARLLLTDEYVKARELLEQAVNG
jgi:hypothetical protein